MAMIGVIHWLAFLQAKEELMVIRDPSRGLRGWGVVAGELWVLISFWMGESHAVLSAGVSVWKEVVFSPSIFPTLKVCSPALQC